ncbi:uncharacterized protein LOC143213648 [Lasioglossum baleicum]|uniref:uncharacterized protein LOC143213648 n=1 Tax=Lasioglossum baleicum TaxID=434251 RepID=UPI003FCCD0AB
MKYSYRKSAIPKRFARFVRGIEQIFKLRSRSPYRRHDERKQRSSLKNCPLRGKTLIKEAPAPRIKIKIPELESGTGEFLLDGGASVNLVVLDVLGEGAEIVSREEIEITGLTTNPIRTLGTTILHIHEAPAFFYVVKRLAIEADGLIGSPFLKQEEAEISYYHGTLVLKNKPIRPIRFSNYQQDSDVRTKHRIDARTSQQIAIRIANPRIKEGYLPRIKTHKQLYIGEAAVLNDGGKCHVMATNTSEEAIDVEIEPQIVEPYDILSTSDEDIYSEERAENSNGLKNRKTVSSSYVKNSVESLFYNIQISANHSSLQQTPLNMPLEPCLVKAK